MLLTSLPREWEKKYILVYQNEDVESYNVFKDGHIEVKLRQNLSDYGNWVGIHILLINKIVPQNSWFLFIHDTCKFINNSAPLTRSIIDKYNKTDKDVIWLCNNGQCNICLIRKNAIKMGYLAYNSIQSMTKMQTIEYEWRHNNPLSPKSFKVNHEFIDTPTVHLGKRFVYNNQNNRDVLLYTSINMEKYFYYTVVESDHPKMP